ESKSIQTLTGGIASVEVLVEEPVLVTILRAGLPLCQGVQNIFPKAPTGFIAMSRDEKTFLAKLEYVALPDMKGKSVVLIDTMIATGGSILDAIEILEKRLPKQIIVLGAIASSSGIARIQKAYPHVELITAAIDPLLNEKGYIVPGLGDAGDRSYGCKHQMQP
ncbi:MAG: uracil phosphoribosyltransferase, partial [Chlamydiales bacterium]|nr:uracil phosphoribosyltransferase [Chlamydiales bacterium]